MPPIYYNKSVNSHHAARCRVYLCIIINIRHTYYMKSFKFNPHWLKAVEAINDPAVQTELLLAIARYGVRGTFTPSANDAVNAVMQIVIEEIDSKQSRRKELDKETVEKIDQEQILFEQVEKQTRDMAMHASPAARKMDIGVCFHRFQCECLARQRFHKSKIELLEDFRTRISPEVYGIPDAEARFFRRKPAVNRPVICARNLE